MSLVMAPGLERCSYCGEDFPQPVSLHHSDEECRLNLKWWWCTSEETIYTISGEWDEADPTCCDSSADCWWVTWEMLAR